MSLCIVKHFQQYMKHTDIPRGDVKQLFISFSKPHKADAGINTLKYSAHSTRPASTSAAKGNSISIATIMKSAGGSQESTFTTFYNKPVEL